MSCKRSRLIHSYMDGELSGLTSILLRWHINRCEYCRSALSMLEGSNHIVRSAFARRKISIPEDELWKQIEPEIQRVKSPQIDWAERKKPLLVKPAYLVAGLAVIVLAAVVGLWKVNSSPPETANGVATKEVNEYPVIEKVDNPNVTVMTYLTDDPKIKIVWLFED